MKNLKKYTTTLILTVMLFFTAAIQQVKAQTSCVVSGVTITASGSSSVSSYNGGVTGTCPAYTGFTGSGFYSGIPTTGVVTYTFSTPVISATISYTAVNSNDVGTITTNASGGTLTLSNPCNATVSGNVLSGTQSPFAAATVTVSNTVPFTTITVTNTGGQSGWVQGNLCNFTVTLPCNAGTAAPTLTTTTKANICPATTVDLTTITATNLPASTTLTWHTGTPATTANKITGTAVAAGTYYAAFFDAAANCYSGTGGNGSATTQVTATVAGCGTSCVVSGVTITATGNGTSTYAAPSGANGGCTTASFTGSGAWDAGIAGGVVTYTFSSPVNSATVRYTAVNGGATTDIGTISVNGGGTASIVSTCGVTASGLTITGSTSPYGDASVTLSSTLPFTTITLTNSASSTGNGWIQGGPCSFVVNPVTCNAGTTAPTLSASTIANVCPTATVNLTTITASNTPGGTTLTWHTATPATTANKVATPNAVAAGTYYAAFFDATNNCYSGTGGNGSATTSVTATVTACCTAGTTAPIVN